MPRPHSIAALILLSGCLLALGGCGVIAMTERTGPVLALKPLELPDAPSLPSLSASELACLTPDAYRRLVEREVRHKEYIEALHAVIQSTREAKSVLPTP